VSRPQAIPTLVGDGEVLYRSVRDITDDGKAQEWTIVDGELKFSQSAFNDRNRQPSVDRAILRRSASESKHSPTDGITSLVARDVRRIRSVQRLTNKGKVAQDHTVDVTYVPLPENAAHAEVQCAPALTNDPTFRRLKEALANMASARGWTVVPASLTKPSARRTLPLMVLVGTVIIVLAALLAVARC
jgi:hypothetical protein